MSIVVAVVTNSLGSAGLKIMIEENKRGIFRTDTADSAPWETFLKISITTQDIKMKFFKFNYTPMGVISQIMPILINLGCCHCNLFL